MWDLAQTRSSSSAQLSFGGVVMSVIPPLPPPPPKPELRGLFVSAAGGSSGSGALRGAGLSKVQVFGCPLPQPRWDHNNQSSLAAFWWGDFERVYLNLCRLLVCTGKSREKQLLNKNRPGFCLQGEHLFHRSLRKLRSGEAFPYRKHLSQNLA